MFTVKLEEINGLLIALLIVILNSGLTVFGKVPCF